MTLFPIPRRLAALTSFPSGDPSGGNPAGVWTTDESPTSGAAVSLEGILEGTMETPA